MTVSEHSPSPVAWHALSAADAAGRLTVDIDHGLTADEAGRRLAAYGSNALPVEPPPSLWVVARAQLTNPMNIMLLIVAVVSIVIGQVATGIVVALLVTFNIVMGTGQEMKARASVDALAQLQVPLARVRRAGRVDQVDATALVPGDVVLLEAGDMVPADGRIATSATLEVQEAALTGRARPCQRTPRRLPGPTPPSVTAPTWSSRTPRSPEVPRRSW